MENESDTQGDTQGDIQGVPQDVTQGDTQGDDLDKWIEYQVAVYPKITEYKNSMDDDFAFEEEKGEQKGGPKTRKVDQKLERPFCNLYPRTQVSLRAKWPTD